VADPAAQNELAALRARDPSFDSNAFTQRIALCFNEMQIGWSNRDLSRVRPFVSDNLFPVAGVLDRSLPPGPRAQRVQRALDAHPRRGKTTPNCPSCGAPLEINQACACGCCNVKVTTGELDWVASRIEQDDGYTG